MALDGAEGITSVRSRCALLARRRAERLEPRDSRGEAPEGASVVEQQRAMWTTHVRKSCRFEGEELGKVVAPVNTTSTSQQDPQNQVSLLACRLTALNFSLWRLAGTYG